MTKQKECTGCPLVTTCPYSRIFEPKPSKESTLRSFSSVPVPYVFEPDGWGEKILAPDADLFFEMVLFGEVVKLIPLVIFALQKGLSHSIGHGSAILNKVYQVVGDNRILVYEPGSSEITDYQEQLKLSKIYLPDCPVKISTPLRLQKDGKIQGASGISAIDFFNTIARRVGLISEFYFSNVVQLPYKQIISEASNVSIVKDLRLRSWNRYSSRQKTLMNLSGLVGTVGFYNLTPGLFKLLELAQYFHMGKNASFGLGRIELL